jgi:CheY-like chemotaxis protein
VLGKSFTKPLQISSTFSDQDPAMAKILIVEDDVAVRSFTARALAASGHAVETAEDGDAGLAKIAARGAYDLVLSDIRMPTMDGIEMAKTAAGKYPGLKILLMTGYAEQRERAADLNAIVVDVVQKPFSLKEIRDEVEKALRG